MREELMVKGDTTNKTSSGKLSAAGAGIKGHGEGLSRCQGSGPLLEIQVPSIGVVAVPVGLCGQKIILPHQGRCRQCPS